MVNYNPACYLPTAISNVLPSSVACPPPPSPIYTLYDSLTSPFSSTLTVLKSSMDALMSLPFLSFLLIPTVTSYSTSLNLLFFYLTWSTLVLSHDPLRVEIVACLAVKILFYVLPSLLFLVFDVLIPSLSESFKTLGSSALPLKDLSRPNTYRQAKVVGWSLCNILVGIACQALLEHSLVTWWGQKSALRVTTTLPLPWAILKDLIRGLLLRDVLTYLVHRYLLHSGHSRQGLFAMLTDLHRTWYHGAVAAPFPLSPSYDHPVTYILKSFIPTYAPAYFWRFHLLTYLLYLILVSLEETFTHSGYATLPTNFVLGGIARRNEMHCLSCGEGNYGTWGLADWVWGTSIGGDAAEELLEELEEAQLKEKMAKQVKKGVRGVRGSSSHPLATPKESGYESGGTLESESGKSGRSSRRPTTRRTMMSAAAAATTTSRGKRRSARRRKDDDDSDYGG